MQAQPFSEIRRKRHLFALTLALMASVGRDATHAHTAAPASAPAKSSLYKASAGPYAVKTLDEEWRDKARKRDVPVRIYLPQGPAAEGKLPVIVFSHGLWASRTSYGYFGRHMASHGYIVIAPTHAGSDTDDLSASLRGGGGQRIRDRGVGRGREQDEKSDNKDKPADAGKEGPDSEGRGSSLLRQRIEDPDNLRNRPLDISFVIDEIARTKTLRDRADMSRIGVAGHSFGAYTAMAAGGMTVDLPGAKNHSFRDPRVKAVLPMSPEGPGTMGIHQGAWDHFAVPVLFLTGTKDYGAGARSAKWRRAAFEAVHGVADFLITLNGATHFTFAGGSEGRSGNSVVRRATGLGLARDDDQARHTEMIRSFATAFFDAFVRGDARAKAWLHSYAAAAHSDCTAETKPAATKFAGGKQS